MTPHSTAKTLILDRLQGSVWLAVFEIKIFGVSENAIASRLPEMALAGLVEGRIRAGTRCKEWRLMPYRFDSTGQGLLG